MGDPSGWNPLVDAASLGKLRLVRLLVEGGADVNGCNDKGDTALLAACKSLQDDTAVRPEMLKLITFLLQNKADPNVQDQAGRTALMLACLQRNTAVVSRLLSAGADPTLQDQSGASALVYAVDAQHPATLEMVIEACRAKGRDIIILIVTDMFVSEEGPNRVTKHYLNLPPSPDSSPASCTSPSSIVLKTSAPNSPEGGNVFSFRTASRREVHCTPRQRGLSEPWLAIPNLSDLRKAYERGIMEIDHNLGPSQSLLTLSDPNSSVPDAPDVDRLPPCPVPRSCGRRNTVTELTPTPQTQYLPPLNNKSNSCGSDSKFASKSVLFMPRPPRTAPPPSMKGSFRATLLKPRLMGPSTPSLVVPSVSSNSKKKGKLPRIIRGQL